MPYTLDISSSQTQAETTSTSASNPTDRDGGENKLIASFISRPTICLDPIQNKNNDVGSILGRKHISDTRKTYDAVQKIVQQIGSISGGVHSPETKISLDPVSNIPQCIIDSIPKRIKVGIAKPCNSGTKTNGCGLHELQSFHDLNW